MNKCILLLNQLWNDESGQGATEYILLLVVVVALALLFRGKIHDALSQKLTELSAAIGSFQVGNGSQ